MPDPGERPLTFTEEARHRQIIDCTVTLMAERGYTGTTLSRIAQRAGISKAAVLYHFASKDRVIEATLMHVYTSLATVVGGRVERAGEPVAMLVAYLRGLIEYLRDNPTHVRVIVEILGQDREGPRERTAASPDANSRWQALAPSSPQGRRRAAAPLRHPRNVPGHRWCHRRHCRPLARRIRPGLDAADELETIVLLATRAI